MNLNTFREQIDALDKELIEILLKRMNISREIAVYKKNSSLAIRDRKRELELIENRTKIITDPVMKSALTDVLEAVLKASRDIQEQG